MSCKWISSWHGSFVRLGTCRQWTRSHLWVQLSKSCWILYFTDGNSVWMRILHSQTAHKLHAQMELFWFSILNLQFLASFQHCNSAKLFTCARLRKPLRLVTRAVMPWPQDAEDEPEWKDGGAAKCACNGWYMIFMIYSKYKWYNIYVYNICTYTYNIHTYCLDVVFIGFSWQHVVLQSHRDLASDWTVNSIHLSCPMTQLHPWAFGSLKSHPAGRHAIE